MKRVVVRSGVEIVRDDDTKGAIFSFDNDDDEKLCFCLCMLARPLTPLET